jgi:small subunit ribosomal protein S13
MARVANVDIPDNKRIEIALTRIYGIGPTVARKITESANIVGNPKVHEMSDTDLTRIREVVDHNYMVEGDLRREVNDNIRRLIDIGSYRGVRHRRGLPVHGQRTKTNSRTKRAGRRTVAGKRRVMKK